jgi:hypothetical protein
VAGYCASCGAELSGRFCGTCGSQASDAAPMEVVALERPREREAVWLDLPDIGSIVQSAWHGVRSHLREWALNFLVVVGAFAVWFGGLGVYLDSLPRYEFGGRHPASMLVLSVFGLVFIGLFVTAYYGLFRAALLTARGDRPTTTLVWRFNRFGPFALLALLAVPATVGLGVVVPVIGFLVAGALFLYAPFFVIDEGVSALGGLWMSISRATRTSSRFTWQLLFYVVVQAVSLSALVLAWLLGAAIAAGAVAVHAPALVLVAGLVTVVLLAVAVPVAVTSAAIAHLDFTRTNLP